MAQTAAKPDHGLVERLEIAIRRSDMNLTRLAKETGVSRFTMAKWRNGTTLNPDPDTLQRVADKLGVTLEWLVGIPETHKEITTVDELVEWADEMHRQMRAHIRRLGSPGGASAEQNVAELAKYRR